VKLWVIALNTLGALVRNRLLIVFAVLFVCTVLLCMTPLIGMRVATTTANVAQVRAFVLQLVSMIMSMVSACGSLLAAWVVEDAVATEMKSGTILAVMARPIKRWEFLAGKYLAVLMLMVCYVGMMLGLSYLLAFLGGQHIQSTPWVLLVYPLVRYAIYAALAMALVTIFHPVVSWGLTLLVAVLAVVLSRPSQIENTVWSAARTSLWAILPSTSLLSEDRFLIIKDASLKPVGWLEHLVTLSYGLDYALVLLLVAMWSFHYRSLRRD
jgi:ABC-type transport system involved in multi-copper enzyme maturation permease subunit